MEAVAEYLRDWARHFFKSKDAISKSIASIDDCDNGFVIKKADKEINVIVKPVIDNIAEYDKEKHYALVTLNNKGNIDKVAEGWNMLKMFPNLTIYFVNPFSANEHKWVIQPHVHEKILDRQNFKTGLKSMAEMVDEITAEEMGRKIA